MFTNVYCETIAVPVYFAVTLIPYYVARSIEWCDQFRISPTQPWGSTGKWGVVQRHGLADAAEFSVLYVGPLALLDTFVQKRFPGVDPAVFEGRSRFGWQTERVVPQEAPSLAALVGGTLGALLLYDAYFYFLHILLHAVPEVYARVHAVHHTHTTLLASFTNRLSVVERLAIILGANECLKLVSAHPLTRLLFIAIFVPLLADSHSGYDFPIWYDKVLPFLGGPRRHYWHHVRGDRYFEPFFTHLEWLTPHLLPAITRKSR